MLAQHLGEGEDKVGGGRAGGQGSAEAHADDDWCGEVRGLAEHRRLGLDPANAPTQHAQPVDHRRVRVGAHERVGDRHLAATDVADLHDLRDVLEIHLVADAHPGRDEREVVEGLLGPSQQRVPLAVAFYLLFYVAGVGVAKAEGVDLNRVVDDEVNGDEWVDFARVFTGALHRRSHRRQVHHSGHAREVLHEDASGKEGQLSVLGRRRGPRGKRGHAPVVGNSQLAQTQQAFEEDLDRHRQARGVSMPVLGKGVDGVDVELRACEPGRRRDHDRIVLASITADPRGASSIGSGIPGSFRRWGLTLKLSATITLSSSIERS